MTIKVVFRCMHVVSSLTRWPVTVASGVSMPAIHRPCRCHLDSGVGHSVAGFGVPFIQISSGGRDIKPPPPLGWSPHVAFDMQRLREGAVDGFRLLVCLATDPSADVWSCLD